MLREEIAGLPPRYQIKRLLGKGSYGSVFLAIDLLAHKEVAVKVFKDIYRNMLTWKRIMREVEIVAKIKNVHSISLLQVILDDNNDNLYMIMEYVEYDLRKFTKLPIFLNAEQVKLIMYDLLCGLEYLHSGQLIHRDIKPGNILINNDLSIKICDFNLSRSLAGLVAEKYDFSIWMRRTDSVNLTDEIQLAESCLSIGSGIFSSISIDPIKFEEIKDVTDSLGNIAHIGDYNPCVLNPIEGEETKEEVQKHKKSSQETSPQSITETLELEELNKDDVDEGNVNISHMGLTSNNSSNIFNMNKNRRKDFQPESLRKNPVSENEDILEKQPSVEYMLNQAQIRLNKKNLKRSSLEFEERMNKDLDRELSTHIVSRYYRPLEIILVEKVYTTAVDIWGVGCIFGELLNMMKENEPSYGKRRPLFPGTSCYPLSPDIDAIRETNRIHTTSTDQLNMIFQTLGTPTTDSFSFVADQVAKEYISSFPKYKGLSLCQRFPAAHPDAIHLLNQTLQYNPFQRITAKEALRHNYFMDIRDKKSEEISTHPIVLTVDSMDETQDLRQFTTHLVAQLNLK